MNRNGEIVGRRRRGRERERYPVVYGAKLRVKPTAQHVKAGELMLEWDPFATPILAEVAGHGEVRRHHRRRRR